MPVNRSSRIFVPFAVAALTLGVAACGSDDAESTPTVTVTQEAEESTAVETTMQPSEPMTETSEPMAETSETMMSEEPVGPNDESGVVDVTVTGDEGILALQYAGSTPAGDAGPGSEKLIVGPGGCFAAVNEGGKPQLLVFPDDATFVLQEGKPSATIDGNEYLVGRQMAVPTTKVAQSNVAGIPDRCTQGSDDTVLVVS